MKHFRKLSEFNASFHLKIIEPPLAITLFGHINKKNSKNIIPIRG